MFREGSYKMRPKTIALVVVLTMFIIILLQNMDEVSIDVLFWEAVQMPKLFLILGSIFFGWVLGWFTHLARQKGRRSSKSAGTAQSESTATSDATEEGGKDTGDESGESE